jgi:3-phytase
MMYRTIITMVLVGMLGGDTVRGDGVAATQPDPTIVVHATAQTDPVGETGDAADDPAIWVHPTDLARSLILGTSKQGGLNAYNLAGKLIQTVSPQSNPDNVDVLYSVPLGNDRIDIAVAGCRGTDNEGVKIWKIDKTGQLSDITAGGLIKVLPGQIPYGSCVFHSPASNKNYFFINDKTGRIEQYEIVAGADNTLGGKLVRTMKVPTQVEGCVADDALGVLYVAEEDAGIWKFSAEPSAGTTGKMIARVGECD